MSKSSSEPILALPAEALVQRLLELERLCVSYAPSVEWECHDGPGLRPGTVQWQANELVIAIYSYDHSLGELLRVAESMEIR